MDGGKNPQAKTERKKEIFGISLWSLRDSAGFWGNRLAPKKEKKICLLRAPFPLENFGGGEIGVFRARVLFVEVLFPLP